MATVFLLLDPSGRIGTATFWRGLAILIALSVVLGYAPILAPRVNVALMVVSLVTYYMYFCLFAKRFHDKGASGWLAMVPLVISLLASAGAAATFYVSETIETAGALAREQGVELGDADAYEAFVARPDVIDEIQRRLAAPSQAVAIQRQAFAPMLVSFWLPSLLLGLWAASGKDPHENRHGPPA